jgi:hypothetical protein
MLKLKTHSGLSIRYNLISTCAGECDWPFHWQHKLCATFSAKVNINYCLPIKVYYRVILFLLCSWIYIYFLVGAQLPLKLLVWFHTIMICNPQLVHAPIIDDEWRVSERDQPWVTVDSLSCTFSPGTYLSYTNKSDRHAITEILLKMSLNIINQTHIY